MRRPAWTFKKQKTLATIVLNTTVKKVSFFVARTINLPDDLLAAISEEQTDIQNTHSLYTDKTRINRQTNHNGRAFQGCSHLRHRGSI